jgi:hypothetical protein
MGIAYEVTVTIAGGRVINEELRAIPGVTLGS